MTTYFGIWIDRRKAHIVTLKRTLPMGYEYRQTVETIYSDVEPRVRLSGGSRSRKTPWGPQDVAAEGKSEARRKQQLKQYFVQVIATVSIADRIIIVGPGETKNQLHKAMQNRSKLAAKVDLVETADKMTPRQLAARVRDYFDIHYYSALADS